MELLPGVGGWEEEEEEEERGVDIKCQMPIQLEPIPIIILSKWKNLTVSVYVRVIMNTSMISTYVLGMYH